MQNILLYLFGIYPEDILLKVIKHGNSGHLTQMQHKVEYHWKEDLKVKPNMSESENLRWAGKQEHAWAET